MVGKSTYRFNVGKLECIALLDGVTEDPIEVLMENVNIDAVQPELAEFGLKKGDVFSYPCTCLLINTANQLVLVDTGFGDIVPSCGKLPDCMQELGVEPKDINVVILTHAHGDHIAGNIDRAGNNVYPNAQWVISKAEWEFWSNLENLKELPTIYTDIVKQKLLPLSTWVQLVDGESEILPGVFAQVLPGHTPGHMIVAVRSEGKELLYTADAMLHPLHVAHPDWCASHWADLDWDMVISSRRKLYQRAASSHSLVLAFHFDPFPSLGHIELIMDGWRWVPIACQ
jgi:glyoxylase-like metal-dependent hydrolase (beta-lactamase superfamily II)